MEFDGPRSMWRRSAAESTHSPGHQERDLGLSRVMMMEHQAWLAVSSCNRKQIVPRQTKPTRCPEALQKRQDGRDAAQHSENEHEHGHEREEKSLPRGNGHKVPIFERSGSLGDLVQQHSRAAAHIGVAQQLKRHKVVLEGAAVMHASLRASVLGGVVF